MNKGSIDDKVKQKINQKLRIAVIKARTDVKEMKAKAEQFKKDIGKQA